MSATVTSTPTTTASIAPVATVVAPDAMTEVRTGGDVDYDVIIVGGAAAGLTAALYCARRTLRTLIITKSLGGQAALATDICNYPGIEQTTGIDLMMKILTQAQKWGAELKYDTVNRVSKNGEIFLVHGVGRSFTAHAVILAFGLTPRNLDVPGEQELAGKGVSYCATCDAPLYKNKRVAVVGGTYEALDAALLLTRLNADVVLINERDGYPASKAMVEQVQANARIKMLLNFAVKKVEGAARVTGIVVSGADGHEVRHEVDGVFVEKGHRIDSAWVGNLVEYDQRKAIVVDVNNQTKTTGLFAAGDVTPIRDKQVVISAGDGAKAALAAYRYIQKQRRQPALLVDWGNKK